MTHGLAAPAFRLAFAWACAVAAAACGPGVAEGPIPPADTDSDSDADTDTDSDTDSDTDTGTETDPEAMTCPETPIGPCPGEAEAPNALLEADQIAPAVRFVDIDDNVLLAARVIDGTVVPLVVVASFSAQADEILATIGIGSPAAPLDASIVPVGVVAGLEAPFDAGGRRAIFVAEREGTYAL